MTIACRSLIHRGRQFELTAQGSGPQIEILVDDLHQLDVIELARTISVNVD